MRAGSDLLATAFTRRVTRAAEARWCAIGVVTAYADGQITAEIDGVEVAGIRRITSWTTPAPDDVALFAVVRGVSSVRYVGIGKIA